MDLLLIGSFITSPLNFRNVLDVQPIFSSSFFTLLNRQDIN